MIPDEIYESATMDGARGWRLFSHITFPMLMPSVTICVFLSLINGMRVFPLIMTLTEGGPGKASTSIALYLYTVGFNQQRFGYGSALTMLFVVMMVVITLLQLKFFKSREVEH
jgi:raffinose/stachyose/melibiose transport system permease protein